MSQAKILTNGDLKAIMNDAIVSRGDLSSNYHLDDILTAGSYSCNKPGGLPSSVFKYGILRVSYSPSRIIQEYFPDKNAGVGSHGIPIWRIRVGSDWEGWKFYSGDPVT